MKISKKFIALFLAFSLVMLSVNLYAKERRGAELIIQRKSDQVEKIRLDGTPWETSVITGIRGELIAVKQDSLLLLDTEGKDVSVNIAEIKVIRVVKKSEVWAGATFGALTGGGIGAIVGALIGKPAPIILSSLAAEKKTILGGIFFGFIIGAVSGGLIGEVAGTDKTIQIEGMSDVEVRKALDKLRKKARIRDYK